MCICFVLWNLCIIVYLFLIFRLEREVVIIILLIEKICREKEKRGKEKYWGRIGKRSVKVFVFFYLKNYFFRVNIVDSRGLSIGLGILFYFWFFNVFNFFKFEF